MNVAHDETTPWGPARNVRGGRIVFKELLRGAEKTPTNFSLVLADTDVTFKSPRHRHNFDQVRLTVEGDFSYARGKASPEGEIVYYPEGAFYGPQNVTGDPLVLLLQLGPPICIASWMVSSAEVCGP